MCGVCGVVEWSGGGGDEVGNKMGGARAQAGKRVWDILCCKLMIDLLCCFVCNSTWICRDAAFGWVVVYYIGCTCVCVCLCGGCGGGWGCVCVERVWEGVYEGVHVCVCVCMGWMSEGE